MYGVCAFDQTSGSRTMDWISSRFRITERAYRLATMKGLVSLEDQKIFF